MTDLPPELVCPTCLGELRPAGALLECDACQRAVGERGLAGPLVDFIREPQVATRGLGPWLMHSRLLARVYQRYWRPLFTAVAGGRPHDLAEELEFVDRALAPAADGVVVDLSCGPGHAALHFHRARRYARVYGLDWSLAMLRELAGTLGREGIDDLPLVRADVARLPFRSGSVDGIHAGAALHMWPDPNAAAAEIGRVLRPGGGFIASTFAHREGPLQVVEEVFERLSDARVFHESELLGLFDAHGIGELETYRRGSLILFWGRRR